MLSRVLRGSDREWELALTGSGFGRSGSWSSLCRPLWLISLLVGDNGACSVFQPGESAEM